MIEDVLEIPLDWEVITLGELNTLKSRTLLPESFPEEIFEYYSIPHYQNGELPGRVAGKSIASAKLILKPKSVLFGKLNPRVEKVWRVGPQSGLRQIGSTEWIPVLPDDRMDPDFLFFLEWSDHVMPKAKTMVSGSTPSRQRVDPTSFYKIRVPLPPLPEQRRIAHVLSTVQEAIAQQEKLIRTTTELKQALMQKLFTEGLRGERLKETEIGMVPESWEVDTIGKMYDFTSKPKGLGIEFPVPFIPMELVPIGDRFIESYELRESVSSGTYVENGDLLIAKITPSFENGKQGFVRIDRPYSYATTEVIPISSKDNSNSLEFLYYYISKADVRNRLADSMEGSTGRQRLSKTILEETLMPKPSLKEQNEIASSFISLDRKVSICEKKKQHLTELFKTLLCELMSGQVRVTENQIAERHE